MTDDWPIPWHDVVQLQNRDGVYALVTGANRDGYELFIPGFGLDFYPYWKQLLGYDRINSAAFATVRKLRGIERTASTLNLDDHASLLNQEWQARLTADLVERFPALKRQITKA